MSMDVSAFGPLRKTSRKRRFLYNSLRDYLRSHRMPVGSQLPSTESLARRFRVSYVTMHSAMDDLVRDGWLVRHQGKGTYIAEGSRAKRRPLTSQLALVLPPQEDIRRSGNGEVVLSLVQGCTHGASQRGADLAMVSLPSTPDSKDVGRALDSVLRYSGAIFVGPQYAPLIRALKKRGFPFVILGGRDPRLGCSVDYDQEAGVRLAVQHLVQHGYRTIGFFGRMSGLNAEKYGYFCRVLKEHRLETVPLYFQSCPDFTDAPQAARSFLRGPTRPEAVFVDNYYKAEALVREMERQGSKVPGDMAVMAYGNEHTGGIRPPLSMLEVPSFEIGCEGTLLLDRLIRGGVLPRSRRTLQPRLLIRQSCGCQVREEEESASRVQEVFV